MHRRLALNWEGSWREIVIKKSERIFVLAVSEGACLHSLTGIVVGHRSLWPKFKSQCGLEGVSSFSSWKSLGWFRPSDTQSGHKTSNYLCLYWNLFKSSKVLLLLFPLKNDLWELWYWLYRVFVLIMSSSSGCWHVL